MDKLVLIDGNSLINRCFFAMPVFRTKEGTPTNAVMGFIKLFLRIVGDLHPKYAVVAFDMHAPTFRHKMYGEYKATRKGMPGDLVVQMPIIKECLTLMNVKVVEKEGIEADDILGTLSRKFSDVESYIYTGDRDSYQLVKENVNVCYTLRGVSELLLLRADNFEENIGLKPSQIVDLKALMGDSSDNIPGIPGVGEKMAKKLLAQYGSFDNIYTHVDEVKGALQKKLIDGREIGTLSKDLATIRTDVELDVELEDCLIKMPFSQAVKQKFAALEFRLLYANNALYEETASDESAQEDLTETISLSRAQEILPVLEKESLIGIAWGRERHIYAGNHEYRLEEMVDLFSPGIPEEDVKAILSVAFSAGKRVILYQTKEMLHLLEKYEIPMKGDFEDISILRYLVDYTGREESLEYVLDSYHLPIENSARSLCRLFDYLIGKVEQNGMKELYFSIEKPICEVLCQIERKGALIDRSLLSELGENYTRRLSAVSKEILEQAGEANLNINSPSQVAKVLFEKLGLPKGKKSKNGDYSVSAEVLEELSADYKIVRDILQYRQLQKLNSTYIEGLKSVVQADGRVHTTYTQTVTSTGRLSSKNPNLQNIPIRTEEGRELRKLFVAPEGHVLIDADYSQIELRLIAHSAECKSLIEAYNSGRDIHRETAAKVFSVSPEEVTEEMRQKAKTVNFGVIYGESAFGLAKTLKISREEASNFIKRYFEVFPEIKAYLDRTVAFAKENGYVETIFGRKREIPELNSSNYTIRQFGERAAMNMPMQGSAADIIKLAMTSVYKELQARNLRAKMILQVHDELLIEAPVEEKDVCIEILKNCMENVIRLSVPLTADVSVGRSWYEAK